MSDSLKAIFFVHWAIFDCKWVLPLTKYDMKSDLKTKKYEKFSGTNNFQIEFELCYSKFPYETRTGFFLSAFVF